ncbi:M56 family metallopeptidase [Algoriphagus sp. SE2]|uniref:M56 family metallopeptidase n=1 Tax=Algoriphagus sp. SE2 TaxID=3141536 RepID=UPI0031CD2F56
MMEYLLKSILCLVVLLLIHRLFLQREVMHQFNRFFLLVAVVFSFIIPFNSIEVAPEKEEIAFSQSTETDFSDEIILPEQSFSQENFTVETAKYLDQPFPWIEVLWSIYSLITLVILIRFIRNIKFLMDQVKQNLKVTYKGMTLVLLPKASLPYTFFKYVFVSREDFENGNMADAIIEHEYTHVREGHSYDILFLEVLLIPFWFHPGLYLAKQAIRLNHEFIADQKALKTTSLHTYQKLLLSLASQEVRFSLVSNLNFSLTKKRLKMMNRQPNPFHKWIKLLVMIPVLGVMVYVFSEKVTANQEPKLQGNEEVLHSNKMGKDFVENSGFGKATTIDLGDHEKYPPTEEQENELSAIQNYKKLNTDYEKKRIEEPHFINRSEEEQQKLLAQFSELGSLYYRIPLELKQTAKRPVHPHAPYVKLESEKGIYYKLRENLTDEEKSQLPPPPPPASKDKVASYQQMYLKYELLNQEGRKYSTKPMAERELMFELYNSLQELFLSMNAVQRRQVKHVNFPYIPIEENGLLTFKALDELTPEQRALNNC